MKHELPAYQKAISGFRALGRPSAAAAAWNTFLTGFAAWVTAEAGMDRELQHGNLRVPVPTARDLAYRTVRRIAAATGTTACLVAIG